jgi:hypothetical protein
MKVTIEITEKTATDVAELVKLCSEMDAEREGATTHGPLTVERLLVMLAEDAGMVISRLGSWEGANMATVLSSHGYQL